MQTSYVACYLGRHVAEITAGGHVTRIRTFAHRFCEVRRLRNYVPLDVLYSSPAENHASIKNDSVRFARGHQFGSETRSQKIRPCARFETDQTPNVRKSVTSVLYTYVYKRSSWIGVQFVCSTWTARSRSPDR